MKNLENRITKFGTIKDVEAPWYGDDFVRLWKVHSDWTELVMNDWAATDMNFIDLLPVAEDRTDFGLEHLYIWPMYLA